MEDKTQYHPSLFFFIYFIIYYHATPNPRLKHQRVSADNTPNDPCSISFTNLSNDSNPKDTELSQKSFLP